MKNRVTLGIDTSNYTTSASVFDIERGEIIANLKNPLKVEHGERGLRQSDALFAHIKNLPEILKQLGEYYEYEQLSAIGVSVKPRDGESSYMPCFLAGKASAYAIASGGAKLYELSHQSGHLAAAIWHCGKRELFEKEFIAFHVSGGTTEVLSVKSEKSGFDIKLLGGTLDINAGQLVDRTGVMLGLDFPCGPELEKLALEFISQNKKCRIHQKVVSSGIGVNLSGAENKVMQAVKDNIPREEIAFFVLDFIARNLDKLTLLAKELAGEKTVLYAGGVMSNSYIKGYLKAKHDCVFAPPVFSSDNAAGVAILAARKYLLGQ